MERIDGSTHTDSPVLVLTSELRPVTGSIACHIVEFCEDVTMSAQLLVGLDGGKEMGMAVVHGASATVEKRRRQADAEREMDYWRHLERDIVVTV